MSSFLSAAENVARQRQNVRRNLKKDGERNRAVELALERHDLVYFWFVLYRKNVSVTVRYLYFWYHCDAVALDSVVSWLMMMR